MNLLGRDKSFKFYNPSELIPERDGNIFHHRHIGVFGGSNIGKTSAAMGIIWNIAARYPRIYWFTGTDGKIARGHIPSHAIITDLNPSYLQELMQRQRMLSEEHPYIDRRLMIVLDDITAYKKFARSEACDYLATSGRNDDICVVVIVHKITALSPAMRESLHELVFCDLGNETTKSQAWELCGMRISKKSFSTIVDDLTLNYHCCVYSKLNKTISRDHHDYLYQYNAQQDLPRLKETSFKMGCKEFWDGTFL